MMVYRFIVAASFTLILLPRIVLNSEINNSKHHDETFIEILEEEINPYSPPNKKNTNETGKLNSDLKTILLRKCCNGSQFYDTTVHKCSDAIEDLFLPTIQYQFPILTEFKISSFSKKLLKCPDTSVNPVIETLDSNSKYLILDSGLLHDTEFNNFYNSSNFCLELIGEELYVSNLTAVYCPKQISHYAIDQNSQIVNKIPKCCPDGQSIDIITNLCSFSSNGTTDNHQTTSELTWMGELSCISDFPEQINLEDTYFSNNNMCLTRNKICFTKDEFCIDSVYPNGDHQTAFVCSHDFINKCCPRGQNLNSMGCSDNRRTSPTIMHFIMNNHFKVKNIMKIDHCTPILFDGNGATDFSWYIDDATQSAVVFDLQTDNKHTIKNYCIDDFSDETSLIPVLKICSEAVRIHHEVSSVENWSWLTNPLGKCCPLNKIYQQTDNGSLCLLRDSMFKRNFSLNSSQLLFSGFPECPGKGHLNFYPLQNSTFDDHAEILPDGLLKIIDFSVNRCKIKETIVSREHFCVDEILEGTELQSMAIVCSPEGYERGIISVILVGLSCAALISAFFVLLFTRVRRGITTMKKVNTLAGKILLSYVASLIIAYLSLGVAALADPKEQIFKCYIIVGFMVFFSISGFCWNTSICVEGLLLTLHVKLKENHRYMLHSLWSWGTPTLVTTVALVMDANSDHFDCNTITPRIGRESCFFPDSKAAFLYFYIPITLTVIINGITLVAAKTLRKSKLKNLEKDPNRIRVRKHESLKQALSIKGIRNMSTKQPPRGPPSNHSGLRTHQSTNTWVEMMKLVLWSGSSWLTELIGTLYASYRSKSEPDWYGYLIYIPVVFNVLRGVGIALIIIINAENKNKLSRSYNSWSSRLSTFVSRRVRTRRQSEAATIRRKTTRNEEKETRRQSDAASIKRKTTHNEEEETRRTSVSTVITHLSDSGSATNLEDLSVQDPDPVKPQFYHSVSEIYKNKKTSNVSFKDSIVLEEDASSVTNL